MISRNTHAPCAPGRRSSCGFTLIEVLITIVIMGVGLLGFALLQTMNVRFAQSANYRTQATNLAYDMLDQMRMNRKFAIQYQAATFTGGAAAPCMVTVGPVTIADNALHWQCHVRSALGEGSSAKVTFTPGDGLATVALTWGDERWNQLSPNTTFTVVTQL